MNEPLLISWSEADKIFTGRWRSESGVAPPKRVVIADDGMTADAAYRLASQGTALLWRGDFHNARQLLQALARRTERKRGKANTPASLVEAFHLHRQTQARRAYILGMLLLSFDDDYTLALRRAPDVWQACEAVYGPADGPFVISLRELQGLIGAYEWRKKGVEIPALGDRIHPHYGVFSPIRGEYIRLVAEAPLPSMELAFDIGSGTGVLAAILARRGIKRIIATDQDQRALRCARENIVRLGLAGQVEIVEANLFPEGRAPLIVCNPPWIPARPSSPIEYAIYDPESRMLRGFLAGLAAHLTPGGEGWLILSDIAEHLGLWSRVELLTAIEQAGLQVVGRLDAKPNHPKISDNTDPLHAARAAEVTSLWRLSVK